MGSNSLRRICKEESKWTDKDATRHKHNFCIEACVEMLQGDSHHASYYHVMKCEYCNSFRCIEKEGSIMGYVPTCISGLPLIKLYRSHKTIGFKGAVLQNMHS